MKICVVGGGPSGLYISKALLSLSHKVDLYEKSSKLYGLFNYNLMPKTPNLLPVHENFRYYLNTEITPYKLKSIENCYDAFVLALGPGPERKLIIPGSEHCRGALEILNTLPTYRNLCIIGMGNTAMNIIRRYFNGKRNIDSITVIGRKDPLNSAFSNYELGCVYSIKDLNIKPTGYFDLNSDNITNDNKRKLERRIKLLKTKTNGNRTLNLLFNHKPVKIENLSDKKIVTLKNIKTGKTYKEAFDGVISSIGFSDNNILEYFKDFKKPIFVVGMCKFPYKNISEIRNDAIEVANKINNLNINK
ncbi:NADPH:adrenodoxin oxidoreductase, mitochondrial [Astathelohania contejeani]|uniref:NADPH:adrenodoxin oxidoreductase, mitochondrial n=1 Tax=Astathelohania contejeani TaxID=164912 RepID=A0ABQ7HZW9_9MICR|nr:NADPH:adrenodoxin oxidoreductase, mitochondrial [Thelohania contejeani]